MTPALINHIVDTTAMVLGISREAICSSSRKRANVIARNIITDVAYNEFLFKYHEIGAVLKRNHSTLIKNKLSYSNLDDKYLSPSFYRRHCASFTIILSLLS